MSAHPHRLEQVRRAVRAVEERRLTDDATSHPVVATGWDELDAALSGGGLQRGVVHEWFADEGERTPPLGVLTHLAWQGLEAGWAIWIGRAVRPDGHALVRGGNRELLRRSILLSADQHERLWAADLAARHPAVRVLVADGQGFDMAATRRLQLAARAGGALVLLARPARETAELSAAATRWRVSPAVSPTSQPRWALQWLRCKGLQGTGGIGGGEGRTWIVEWRRAQGVVGVPARVADRAADAAARGRGRAKSKRRGPRRRSA